MKPLRMLALSPVPEEGAGCRFRIAQYVPALERAGIDVTISPFFTREFFQLVYRKGYAVQKTALFVQRALDRARTVAHRSEYDVIFIYREALPIGPAVIERLLSRTPGVAVIYDFDDAVYLPNTSDANRAIGLLKWPQKVARILERSDGVIAGNEYLAAFARRHTDAVRVIPTCVDTTKFIPQPHANPIPVVGWIGTPTTAPYLMSLAPALQQLARTRRFVLRVCGAGTPIAMPGVTVENTPWTLDGEVALFNTCDVGVYPLTDDEWARGKCGFKAIQFMACEVPVVAAPVGVNRDIITDGVDGFLAFGERDWSEKIARLLDDAALRASFGRAGRDRIERDYSLRANAPKMIDAVAAAVERARGRTTGAVPVAAGARRA
ncbi:MAG TPA: glycosyltransferase family 4 protein [Vicinamibacterales bacterium]|nr:glycosyltransferase family 4 protein [Vicinamibacterales bacterium]